MINDEQFLADLANASALNNAARRAAELEEWCHLKTWTVEEGLLLVHGVAPAAADIHWGKRVLVRNARPLDSHEVFLAVPTPSNRLLGVTESPDGFLVGKFEVDDDQAKNHKLNWLREIEERLTRAWRRWKAEEFGGARYAPMIFIEWAKENGIDVPEPIIDRIHGSIASRLLDTGCSEQKAPGSKGELPHGPERDREIFEHRNALRTSGARNFLAQTAAHFGVSPTAIKQAIDRHKNRPSRGHEGHSICSQLLAASSKEK